MDGTVRRARMRGKPVVPNALFGECLPAPHAFEVPEHYFRR
jgi:hypothetical protein